jgi:hypothetical protein
MMLSPLCRESCHRVVVGGTVCVPALGNGSQSETLYEQCELFCRGLLISVHLCLYNGLSYSCMG